MYIYFIPLCSSPVLDACLQARLKSCYSETCMPKGLHFMSVDMATSLWTKNFTKPKSRPCSSSSRSSFLCPLLLPYMDQTQRPEHPMLAVRVLDLFHIPLQSNPGHNVNELRRLLCTSKGGRLSLWPYATLFCCSPVHLTIPLASNPVGSA